jgi:hypothetical protein
MKFSSLRSLTIALCATLSLAACSEPDVSSPGETEQVDNGGGGNNGGGNGGTGGQTGTCPTGTVTQTERVGGNTTCGLSGVITSNLTLTSGVIYQLDGVVEVGVDVGGNGNKAGGQSVTLTIQPGVKIFGTSGQTALQVNRGSRIIADGTATLPITFTSRQDILGQATATSRQQWGGIVILGRAPINDCIGQPGGTATCESDVEGVPAGFFGGDQVNDNSGILRYVVVKYSGFTVSANNELNGITLAGVGAGTTIDYVQVHNSSDDGIEWFGGTVNAKHLVVTGISDDGLDWASGWVGRAQYVLAVQAADEGDKNVEADNLPGERTKTPLTAPIIANFTLIGKTGTTQNASSNINQREGVGGTLVNGVVTGSASCLDVDHAPTLLSGLRYHSVLLACQAAFGDDADGSAATAFNNAANTNNVIGTSSLVGSYFPGPVEQAMTPFNATSLSGFFETAAYVGAFSPTETASNNWALGWTFGLFAAPECPTGTLRVGVLNNLNRCELQGVYTSDLHLVSGNLYQLSGVVEIGRDVGGDGNKAGGDAANLTVDAGVTVFGTSGQTALQINRGSKIFVNGTRTSPVVFTSLQDVEGTVAVTARQQWGGIVVLGRAPINDCIGQPGGTATCESDVEGVPAGFFGGALADDSSGSLRYMQVKHSGFTVSANNELNGITLAGVGNGTTIEYVQVHNSSDDGIEWFGGTVNAKYIVVTGISDDGLDWASGWTGNLQFVLAIQASDEGDKNVEADNLPGERTKTPLTAPNVSNFTFIGKIGTTQNASSNINQREGVGGYFVNGIVTGSNSCLDIDHAPTVQANPQYRSVMLNCVSAFGDDADNMAADLFNAASNTNSTTAVANTLTNTFVNGPTENARTVFDPTTLSSFFTNVTYIGAVRDANDTWWQGWTCGLTSATLDCN